MKLNAILVNVLVVFLTSYYSSSLAQTDGKMFKVSATIVDSTSKKPLEYVAISLYTDSGIVKGATMTDVNGRFNLTVGTAGNYQLSLHHFGYDDRSISLTLDSAMVQKDLDVIVLSTNVNKLQEVVIKTRKTIITQEIDKISYNVQADPDSKSDNLLEMMRKVPLISLDAGGNIILQGNRNFKIFLNGRPSSMLARNVKEVLQSMPASMIQRIEVMTNPPVKYDSEGLGGIINIITVKKLTNGYSGGANLSHKMPVGGQNFGSSLNIKNGRFGISTIGGIDLNNAPHLKSSVLRNTEPSDPSVLDGTSLSLVSGKESNKFGGYFNLEVSYELDSLKLISTQFNVNGSETNTLNDQYSSLIEADDLLQSYKLLNDAQLVRTGFDGSVNYEMGFKSNKERILTFSYKFFSFKDDQQSLILFNERYNYPNLDYKQNNKGSLMENTIQVDYILPIKKGIMETGLKSVFRKNRSYFGQQSFDIANDEFINDPSQTNNFFNNQSIYGFYNSYKFGWNKWSFKAGGRVEANIIRADFLNSATFKRHYLSIIPSIAVQRRLSGSSSINFNYGQRIQRPDIEKLNPFVDRSNPDFESTGNPDLKQARVENSQISYTRTKKGTLNTSLAYFSAHDLVFPVYRYNSVLQRNQMQWGNIGKAKLISANLYLNYLVTKEITMTVNGKLAYGRISGSDNGTTLENEGFMNSLSLSARYSLGKDWRCSFNSDFIGKSLDLQGGTNALISTSVGLSKAFFKKKMNISATASNPFNKFRNNIITTSGFNFTQVNNNESYFRNYSFNLSYSFGKLKKEAIRKNKRGIVNDDITRKTE